VTVPAHPAGWTGPALPFELVLDNTIVGVSYMRDRHFLWANARMAEIFGYVSGELLGRSVRDLYVTEDEYNDVGRMYATLSRSGFYTHERAMVRKSGEMIWCRVSGRLLSDDDPNPASVWVVQDLTDRKRAEDQLKRANVRLEQAVERRTQNLRRSYETLQREIVRRQSAQLASAETREKYRALFRHIPMGVVVTNEQGDVVEANRAMQAYLAASTRRELDRLMQDETRARGADGDTSLAKLIKRHVPGDTRRVEKFEVAWQSNRGLRHFSAIAAALTGHGLGAVIAFQDETAQHLAREREYEQRAALAHASRVSLMGQMATALAHELGQPLTACQSYVMGIRHRFADELRDRPELAHVLEKITTHLAQAGSIIGNVRAFLSRHTPHLRPVDLKDLADRTLALLDIQLRAAGVRMIMEIEDPLPLALGRPVELQQVLVNLMVNAIDAMSSVPPARRTLTIRMSCDRKSFVAVHVSDTGPGVPLARARSIFEPYVTTKETGLGMGLMICRTIVESHGGTIRLLTDRAPGACFKFTVPVAAVSNDKDLRV
jgi:PAS domain S-box-containing protein